MQFFAKMYILQLLDENQCLYNVLFFFQKLFISQYIFFRKFLLASSLVFNAIHLFTQQVIREHLDLPC